MIAMRKFLLPLVAGFGTCFVLTASKCQTDTIFVDFTPEICGDKLDNDGDGKTDCKDSDCSNACTVTLNLFPIPSPIKNDSLTISGTQHNASSIAIQIAPDGEGGTLQPTQENWEFTLLDLSKDTTYTVTVIASDALGNKDTATSKFTKQSH